jgi:hypothetical protein
MFLAKMGSLQVRCAILPSSIGCLPSLETWSLHRGDFERCAWDIIDGDLGWGSVLVGLSASDFVVARDFLIG